MTKQRKTKEELKAQAKIRMDRYREKHKEEIRKYQAENARRNYRENPEKYRKRRRDYYWAHREELLEKQRGKDRHLLNDYHKHYRKRKKFFHLSSITNHRLKSEDKITAWDLWKIAKKQRLICALTGDKLTNENLSVDHILASARGGRNIPSNIRLVTREANILKNSHSDKELLELCQKVVKTLMLN